ncbi:hypothetical protein SAMN04488033_11956 [Salegentibacter agarivorans]|uniref:Uncharacterized protein n=1 Tax=Salegentibacter agarivorans TaxID=345907 RepID=A0A1I2N9F4_9FLAO|nr:hypothetical protein [Salegentibacter agarivorans]SFG00118.1 hypothetical protein SAMN04488033_11956 [Salegentibacter agarivorans]
MRTEREKSLKALETMAKSKLNTLRPSNSKKNKMKPAFLKFDGYLELFTTIESLLNVCILTSEGDSYRPSKIKCPEESIRKSLELVVQLLPFEEGEFLDEAYRMFKRDPE